MIWKKSNILRSFLEMQISKFAHTSIFYLFMADGQSIRLTEIETPLAKLSQVKIISKYNKQSITMYSKVNKKLIPEVPIRYVDKYSYKETDVLGEGYSSTVYKGYKNQSKTEKQGKFAKEPVAIKKMKKEPLENALNKKLLQSELQNLRAMKGCKNIIDVLDIFEEEEIFIISELCQSGLQKKIKQHVNFKQGQKYMIEIIRGYKQILQKQIVHRDLKPNNILIDQNGSVKIADFGFAIQSKETRKQTMYNIGSPLYMAPQSLQNNEYSHLTDVWSIGIIAYQLFAGKTPWKAKTEEDLIKILKKDCIENIMKRQKVAMPLGIKKMIIQALQYDKNQRLSPTELANYEFGSKKSATPESSVKKSLTFKTQRKSNNYFKEDLEKTSKKKISFPLSKMKSPTKFTQQKTLKKGQPVKNLNQQYFKTERPKTSSIFSPRKKYQEKKLANLRIPCSKSKKEINYGYALEKMNSNKVLKTEKLITDKDEGEAENAEQMNKIYSLLFSHVVIYEILYRVTEEIEASKLVNQINYLISVEKQRLVKSYCSLICKSIYKIKEFPNSNFLRLPSELLRQFQNSIGYRKITKINNQNLERFSKAKHLRKYWDDSKQPNFQFSINATTAFIQKLVECTKKSFDAKEHIKQIVIAEGLVIILDVLGQLKKSGYGSVDESIDRQMLRKYLHEDRPDKLPNNLEQILKGTSKI